MSNSVSEGALTSKSDAKLIKAQLLAKMRETLFYIRVLQLIIGTSCFTLTVAAVMSKDVTAFILATVAFVATVVLSHLHAEQLHKIYSLK